jgi:hypothetical protein
VQADLCNGQQRRKLQKMNRWLPKTFTEKKSTNCRANSIGAAQGNERTGEGWTPIHRASPIVIEIV